MLGRNLCRPVLLFQERGTQQRERRVIRRRERLTGHLRVESRALSAASSGGKSSGAETRESWYCREFLFGFGGMLILSSSEDVVEDEIAVDRPATEASQRAAYVYPSIFSGVSFPSTSHHQEHFNIDCLPLLRVSMKGYIQSIKQLHLPKPQLLASTRSVK